MNLHRSTYRLVEQAPDDSARHVLSTAQCAVALGGIVGCAVALLLNWSLTLIALAAGATLLHLATSIYKLYVLTRGWSVPRPGEAAPVQLRTGARPRRVRVDLQRGGDP